MIGRRWAAYAYSPSSSWLGPKHWFWTKRGAERFARENNILTILLGYRSRWTVSKAGK